MQPVNNRVIFFPASMLVSELMPEGVTDAPYIGVKLGEIGYWPVYSRSDLATLNGCEVSQEVLKSAMLASMTSWDAPIAAPARQWLAEHEPTVFAQLELRPTRG